MIYDSDIQRVTTNEEFFRHLSMVRAIFPHEGVRVYNYLNDEELASTLPEWATMDAIADEFEVFAHCTKAELLLMAKSSFSYIAALANPNQVLYQKFWHPPLNHWQQI